MGADCDYNHKIIIMALITVTRHVINLDAPFKHLDYYNIMLLSIFILWYP